MEYRSQRTCGRPSRSRRTSRRDYNGSIGTVVRYVLSLRQLGKVGIARAIKATMAARSQRTGITTDRVLKELELVAFSRIMDGVNGTDGTDGATGAAFLMAAAIAAFVNSAV